MTLSGVSTSRWVVLGCVVVGVAIGARHELVGLFDRLFSAEPAALQPLLTHDATTPRAEPALEARADRAEAVAPRESAIAVEGATPDGFIPRGYELPRLPGFRMGSQATPMELPRILPMRAPRPLRPEEQELRMRAADEARGFVAERVRAEMSRDALPATELDASGELVVPGDVATQFRRPTR